MSLPSQVSKLFRFQIYYFILDNTWKHISEDQEIQAWEIHQEIF